MLSLMLQSLRFEESHAVYSRVYSLSNDSATDISQGELPGLRCRLPGLMLHEFWPDASCCQPLAGRPQCIYGSCADAFHASWACARSLLWCEGVHFLRLNELRCKAKCSIALSGMEHFCDSQCCSSRCPKKYPSPSTAILRKSLKSCTSESSAQPFRRMDLAIAFHLAQRLVQHSKAKNM